jgi:DNA-binding GntR family transcriptional regulator
MRESVDSGIIERHSLHHQLVTRIRKLIVSGQLAPGAKVPEKYLCESFEVSRTPLREALKVLASEGVVRLEPNRGAWITAITPQEVNEVFPVLGALEALSGEIACQLLTEADLHAIQNMHAAMLQSYDARDLPAYFKANQDIHAAILAAARNDTLSHACQSLSVRMQRARYLANMSRQRWSDAVQEHQEILQALEARNGEQLGHVLRAHMRNTQASVLLWLANKPVQEPTK